MKKKKKVIVGVVLVVVVGAAAAVGVGVKYYGLGDILKNVSSSTTSGESVYVDSVEKIMDPSVGGTIQRFSGIVEPQQTWKIESSSDKKIKEIYVEEGDQVKVGQELFTYDTTDAEESLVEAEIELDRLNSEIETAKSQIETMQKELAKVTAEDQRLEYTNLIQTKENTLKKNEYDLKKQQLTLEQLKSSIANATVESDIDGIVKTINEDAGSSSYYGYSSDDDSNAFMTILSTGNYRIKGQVNEQNRSAIIAGLPVLVHSRVNEEDVWSGTMGSLDTENTVKNNNDYYYGSSSDANSSNYNFYVELDNSDGLILGQHVFIEIDNGQNSHTDGIWLNSYYISQDENGESYVWAADSRDRMEKRTVTLGEYDAELDQYEITEGLTEEDYIAFPTEEIEEGMAAERNIENATLGVGAGSATGYYSDEYIGEDIGSYEEEYLGGDDEDYYGDGYSDGEMDGYYEDGYSDGEMDGYYEDGYSDDEGLDGDFLSEDEYLGGVEEPDIDNLEEGQP